MSHEFRAKQVKDGWAVIDDLGEACATFGTLREANREATRLQGIWDRARVEPDSEIERLHSEITQLQSALRAPRIVPA